jgi:hypothetical protein
VRLGITIALGSGLAGAGRVGRFGVPSRRTRRWREEIVGHLLQLRPARADPRRVDATAIGARLRGSNQVTIAYQPATTPERITVRAAPRRGPHDVVRVEMEPRSWTALRLAGLVAATAIGVAVLTAIVAGTALFAVLNFGG